VRLQRGPSRDKPASTHVSVQPLTSNAGTDERTVEEQIIVFMKELDDGDFSCRPVMPGVGSDFLVRRESANEPAPVSKRAANEAPKPKRAEAAA
jgi:hypothetical protein